MTEKLPVWVSEEENLYHFVRPSYKNSFKCYEFTVTASHTEISFSGGRLHCNYSKLTKKNFGATKLR